MATFTRKEIAFLIDALSAAQNMDAETRKAYGMTDKRLAVMLFKLWRLLNVERGTKC